MSLVSLVMLATVVVSGCSNNGVQTANQVKEDVVANETERYNTSGFPIMKEPISLRFVARMNPQHGEWNEMTVVQEYAKKTNMNIEFEVYPVQNFGERKNLLFASNDLPDAFINSWIEPAEQLKYGSTGMLIPLEGLIDKHAPNLKALFEKYPDAKKTITAPDGHIYALPTMVELDSARTSKIWINQDCLNP